MSAIRPKILIVDDTPANLLALGKILNKLDVEVIEAASGNDALIHCLEHDFALALLDVNMPGMDGYELAGLMHDEPRTAQVPIIFLTAAYSDEIHRRKGYDVGAVEYIQKPVDDFILRSKARVFLDLYLSRRALEAELARSTAMTQVLRESEARLRHAVSEAPIPIMIHAEDGAVVLLSRVWTELTGYTASDIPTVKDWTARAYGAKGEEIARRIKGLYALEGPRAEGEHEVITADGSVRVWDFRSAPIEKLPDGRRLVISMAVDVTDRHRVQEELAGKTSELERSNADLEQFAYVASHDLREPLRMVNSFLGLLDKKFGPALNDEAREYIGFARDGAKRMDSLILDLLDYSRIGRNALPEQAVDLGLALATARSNLTVAIEESGATLELPQSLPALCVDMGEFVRLFQNLIGNAIKYRSPDRAPVISVTATALPNAWEFRVADNGIGIEAQYYDRVFQIFQRLHSRAETAGTGIGLAVCKRVVNRYRGRIWVESVPGEGSTFCFTLPVPKPGM
ncbi:Putative Signal transduction histidine kinase(CheY-like superfamily,5-203;Signal transduction histidine kinase, homodimeric,270-358;ATPase-like, ATP-binding domain,398-510) [Magnetospirillum sp. XM-1]|uniref:ATP-binding protein n=1 Tax=Magnetospirillum sp. XM-1 TaxID=1663591 RepID=UPI00073DC472|nr:ATP-binding protein [Magnetospirillum sp. XM-1]CUW38544.1 Putative Signal transduction histidine kinase(CheY-like superfamily,5-203;Signal transduction histidine kinase, homodimeric,270-358;ATPase-like, ATP-binding domain,398-510) [Magnetospirillum sp. XM-1]